MTDKPTVDLVAAHRHFSAWCFNQAWDLMEKADRTETDDRLMVLLNQASIFHWINRPDCADKNISVGYWQASRIQALLGNAPEAMRHARTCLDYSTKLEPFYLGYAHEALARAAGLANDGVGAAQHLETAEAFLAQVSNEEGRRLLTTDLAQLKAVLARPADAT